VKIIIIVISYSNTYRLYFILILKLKVKVILKIILTVIGIVTPNKLY